MHTNGYLLGLIRSHWGAENVEAADAAGEREEPLNTGIAIVTPIKEVLDIIVFDQFMRNKGRGGPGKHEVLD